MRIPKLGMAAVALAGALAVSGCAYDDYGFGGYGGYPYGGYGPYGAVSVGVGYGGGYGYGNPYYGGYGLGGYYGSPFGWYDDFYYPGTGIYVYDSYRRPRMWDNHQRRYWQQRSGSWRDGDGGHHRDGNWSNNSARVTQPNWSGFDHRPGGGRRH